MMIYDPPEHQVANILWVGDRPQYWLSLEDTVAAMGTAWVHVDSGLAALRQVRQQAFALIIIAAQLPDLDAIEVAQLIRQRHRNLRIPIIMLTTVDDHENDLKQKYDLEAIDYLVEPHSATTLTAKVASVIQLAQTRQQLESQITGLAASNDALYDESNTLKRQLLQQNSELQQRLKFERTLRQITDQVRDSFDEAQILQAVVRELTIALNALGCNATLYDTEQQIATVAYEYSLILPSDQGRVLNMADAPEIYAPLQQGQCLEFCSRFPNPDRGPVACFVCPIQNSHIIGDLWVINSKYRALTPLEAELVEQVASQCTIAIRQARLYQLSQANIKTLQDLNQLKDDFLSTISHELRTPITTMKMAIQMLEMECKKLQLGPIASHQPVKINTYLKILQQECDRENKILGDLLLLQHLEASTHLLSFVEVHLQDWLSQVIAPFQVLMQHQRQILEFEVAEDLPPVSIDTFSLEHLLVELLNNAYKYTPSGECITVTAHLHDATAIRIEVSNSGVEIPADQCEHIFDKFYRIPQNDRWKHGGTGLGLALARRLAEYCGGQLQVASHTGTTRFTVLLPLHPPLAPKH